MASATEEFQYFHDSASAASTLDSRCSDKTIRMDEFPDWIVPIELGQSREYTQIRQELYDSEKSYLGYLCILQKLFVNPIGKLPKLVHRSEARTLFGDLTSIFMTNKELLITLRSKPTVHEAFSQIVPFLKLYASYAGNYQNSLKVYSKLMAKTDFRTFIESQESDPRLMGIKFQALLIMPIQRIPRYILLLQRLRDTTARPKERNELKRVIAQMEDLTFLIDSCIAEFENGEKLWDIQESLGLKEGIVAPGRRLLKEGSLFKRNMCGEATYHERYFWIFNDILVYGKRRIGMGPRFECSCIFQLRHVQMTYIELEGAIQIKCKNHSLSLTSDAYETIVNWNEVMSEAIERVKVLRKTLRKESSLQPVKEFKTQIRKRFTKKFVNTTYVYKMGESKKREEKLKKKWADVLASPSDINLFSSPFRSKQGTSKIAQKEENHAEEMEIREESTLIKKEFESPRKRRAPQPKSPYDDELRAALRKRRAANGEPMAKSDTPDRPIVLEEDFGSRRAYDKEKRQEEEEINYRVLPKEKDEPKTVLNTLQIRKYSYMEHSPPKRTSVFEPDNMNDSQDTENAEDQGNEQPPTKVKKVPWWVEEAQPAEFRNNNKRSGLVASACSIL
ncbi:unnamed protein product, partial [Mesorhabditis belari]|uniref:DH domain-containing protein n=1 Tax=Mesorhabditis belari TaxID=2138241 RepID=A0AAF3J272_9BILA